MSAQAMGFRAIPRSSLSLFGALPPLAMLAGVIILGYVAIAISAPLWVPFDPSAVLVGPPISPPAADHWFGTDSLGRDVFSRVMYGSRPVLIMALSSTTLAVLCGATIGLLAGYKRGWFDQVAMRLTDVLVSFPTLILAMLVLSAIGNTALYVVLTVAFINVPRIARVVRSATLTIVAEDYVTAAVTRGESTASIIFIELMPNVSGTIFVEFAVRSGFVIVFIGALGFLGFGAPPPTSEWGVMINEGRTTLMLSVWPVLAPASAMALLVVALNLFTDGIARRIGAGSPSGPRV
jgi:peptide/nickel transport system permease protein